MGEDLFFSLKLGEDLFFLSPQLPFDKYEVVGNLELLISEMGNGGKKVKNP